MWLARTRTEFSAHLVLGNDAHVVVDRVLGVDTQLLQCDPQTRHEPDSLNVLSPRHCGAMTLWNY